MFYGGMRLLFNSVRITEGRCRMESENRLLGPEILTCSLFCTAAACIEHQVLTSHKIVLLPNATAAVRFLTRTFRNVFYVRVWKLIVRLWRSQRSRTVASEGSW